MAFYEGELPFFFLSNAHPDEKTRKLVADTLKTLGFRLNYFDHNIYKQPMFSRLWEGTVITQLNHKNLVATVAIIDEAYLHNEYCRAELALTKLKKLPIIAIFTDDAPIPESYRHLLDDEIYLFCDAPDREILSKLQNFDCLSACYDRAPRITAPKEFDIYADVLVKFRGNAETVTIPDGISTIGAHAFMGHREIRTLTLPGSMRLISYSAFYHMEGLTEIRLNEGLHTVRVSAFNNCRGLKEIRFPRTLTHISMQNFEDCIALERIYLPENMPYRPKKFNRCQAEIITYQ